MWGQAVQGKTGVGWRRCRRRAVGASGPCWATGGCACCLASIWGVPLHPNRFHTQCRAWTCSCAVTRRLLPPDTNDRAAVLATCRQLVRELRAAAERTGGGGAAAAGAAKRARQAAATVQQAAAGSKP